MKSPLIVKWRYWDNRSSAGRSANYIEYIGTREGVEIPEEKNYLDYMGTRPRVEKHGQHGLFSDDDTVLDMKTEREKLNRHNGRVFTLIFSLSREDAESTGFNCAERWCSLMRMQKVEIAKQFGIAPEHLKWYGAFHNEPTHPHIHVLLYSDDPANEGYLKKRGLREIKSAFATEIFRHELDEIYREQTKQRNDLTQIAREEIAELVLRIQNGTCDNPKLIRLMRELSEKLKDVSGRKVYGFLPPDVKSLVNEITDALTEDANVKRLYDLWYEGKYAILKSYTEHLPPKKPLSQEDTFKPIRNAVIREAIKLSQESTAAVFSSADHRRVTVSAVTRLMRNASRIFEERIRGQLALHPELAVDSKLKREIEAKKRGIQIRM